MIPISTSTSVNNSDPVTNAPGEEPDINETENNELKADPLYDELKSRLDDIVKANWNIPQQESLFKTFPPIPKSRIIDETGAVDELKTLDIAQIFARPNFNERESLARDDQGNIKNLSAVQLAQVRQNGSFTVDSLEFPGQQYTWILNSGLQKGIERINDTFLDFIASMLRLLIIIIPDRLYKDRALSVRAGFGFMWDAVVELITLPFGKRKMSQKYCDNDIKSAIQRLRREKHLAVILSGPSDETTQDFQWNGIHANFTYSFEFQKLADIERVVIDPALTVERRKHIQERSQLYSRLSQENPGKSHQQILQMVSDEEAKMLERKTYEILKNSYSRKNFLGDQIISRLKAVRWLRQLIDDRERRRNDEWNLKSEKLREMNPIRGRIGDWIMGQRDIFFSNWRKVNPLKFHQEINSQTEFSEPEKETFLRTSNFMQSSKVKTLRKHMRSELVPSDKVSFQFRIYRPSNWIIEKDQYGPSYYAKKCRDYEITTRYFGWRIAALFVSMFEVFWNSTFWCFLNVFYGPYGLRSMVGVSNFQPNKDVNALTGIIEPSGDFYLTWIGRVAQLWGKIAESRSDFEGRPDAGFFGKSFSRIFNVVWNYVFVGLLGTLIAFLGHLLLFGISFPVSLILGITAIVWSPIVVVCSYFLSLIFFVPIGAPGTYFPLPRLILWEILFCGFVNIIFNIASVLFLVVCAFLGSVLAILQAFARHLYDFLIFHLIIRCRGRVPYEDTFVAALVSGPGLSMNYYYQLNPGIVILLVQLQLESIQLQAYKKNVYRLIEKPYSDLQTFLSSFSQFALSVDNTHPIVEKFNRVKRNLRERIDEEVELQRAKLKVQNVDVGFRMFRLHQDDLVTALDVVAKLSQEFVPGELWQYLSKSDKENFWQSKNLLENNWKGFAEWIVKDTFGDDQILVPIENFDNAGFKIKVEHINARSYLKRLWEGKMQDDLELKEAVRPVVIAESTLPSPKYKTISVTSIGRSNFEWMFGFDRSEIIQLLNHLESKIREKDPNYKINNYHENMIDSFESVVEVLKTGILSHANNFGMDTEDEKQHDQVEVDVEDDGDLDAEVNSQTDGEYY